MTIDLFDILYDLFMELVDLAVMYCPFSLIVNGMTRFSKKSPIYITTIVFLIIVISRSFSSILFNNEIGFYDIATPIIFIFISVHECDKVIEKINTKHEDTSSSVDEEINMQNAKTNVETKKEIPQSTVGNDISSGKHTVAPTNPEGGLIHILSSDGTVIKRICVDKKKVIKLKSGTTAKLYNCKIEK